MCSSTVKVEIIRSTKCSCSNCYGKTIRLVGNKRFHSKIQYCTSRNIQIEHSEVGNYWSLPKRQRSMWRRSHFKVSRLIRRRRIRYLDRWIILTTCPVNWDRDRRTEGGRCSPCFYLDDTESRTDCTYIGIGKRTNSPKRSKNLFSRNWTWKKAVEVNLYLWVNSILGLNIGGR